ncbi:hypothetical protein ERJ75_001374300 [Trypanosoma vivax]|nr:hypothetical protein ERJ75_001374300 [Trypanosoma vivax]
MSFDRHALAHAALCLWWFALASTCGDAVNGNKAGMKHAQALEICKLGALARKAAFDAEAQRSLAMEATVDIGPKDAQDTEGAETLRDLATALALVVRERASTKSTAGPVPHAQDLEKMATTLASLVNTGARLAQIEGHYRAARDAGSAIYWNRKDFIYTWDAYNPKTDSQNNVGCIIASTSASKNLDKGACGLEGPATGDYKDSDLTQLIDTLNAAPWNGADNQDGAFDQLSTGQACGLTDIASAGTNAGLEKTSAPVTKATRGGTWGGLFLIAGTTSTKIGTLWLGGTRRETAPTKEEKTVTDERHQQIWQLRHHARALARLTAMDSNHACGGTQDTNLTNAEKAALCTDTPLAKKRRVARQLSARVASLFTKHTKLKENNSKAECAAARPQQDKETRDNTHADTTSAPTDNSMQGTVRAEHA